MELNPVCAFLEDNSLAVTDTRKFCFDKTPVKEGNMLLGSQKSSFVEFFHYEQGPNQKWDVSSGVFDGRIVFSRKSASGVLNPETESGGRDELDEEREHV